MVAGSTPEDADGGGGTCDGGAECSVEGWCLQRDASAALPVLCAADAGGRELCQRLLRLQEGSR